MAQYTDIYARDNFGDTGVYPSTGNPYQSPDIIPLQSGTMTVATAASTYNGPDQGRAILTPGANNLYVRAKNLRSTAQTGTAALYYSTASLLLLPSDWTVNQVLTANGLSQAPFINQAGGASLAPNEIGLANPPFLLQGLPTVQNDHYCLITVITTPNTSVQIPASFASNAEFAQWVQNTPAVAWRNISLQANTVPTIVKNTNFASTNPTSAYFHFRITGKNFPVGSTVVSQCTDQRSPINQTVTLPQPDANGNQVAGFDSYLPGNFSSTLVNIITPPTGKNFIPGSTLAVDYYQYPDAGPTELEREVGRFVATSREIHGHRVRVGAFLIPLGQVTFSITGA